jgi:hypothetical protein
MWGLGAGFFHGHLIRYDESLPRHPGLIHMFRCTVIAAWGVEPQEVSPRPGRTTVALGLRALLGSGFQTLRTTVIAGVTSCR